MSEYVHNLAGHLISARAVEISKWRKPLLVNRLHILATEDGRTLVYGSYYQMTKDELVSEILRIEFPV